MLSITKQSDYGLILLSFVYKKGRLVKLSELIEETNLPNRFLARIAAELAKQGLLISKEGKAGGYVYTPKLKQISFYDFLNIFEKDVMVVHCVDPDYQCQFDGVCQHHDFIKKRLNVVLINELKKIKLLDLFK